MPLDCNNVIVAGLSTTPPTPPYFFDCSGREVCEFVTLERRLETPSMPFINWARFFIVNSSYTGWGPWKGCVAKKSGCFSLVRHRELCIYLR